MTVSSGSCRSGIAPPDPLEVANAYLYIGASSSPKDVKMDSVSESPVDSSHGLKISQYSTNGRSVSGRKNPYRAQRADLTKEL